MTIISKPELQILLNLLSDRVEVRYPVYDFDILHGMKKDGYDIRLVGKAEDYDAVLNTFGEHSREFPRKCNLLSRHR